jgi:hypothetical protein
LSSLYHLYDFGLKFKYSTSNRGVVYIEERANDANVVNEIRRLDLAYSTKVFVVILYFNKASRGCVTAPFSGAQTQRTSVACDP